MTRTRLWLLLFSAVALVASAMALYVHYNLITDSSYTSFCDISATINCEAVYESAYGTVRGLSVAVGGVVWSALVFLLVAYGMRRPKSPEAQAAGEYVFLLSIVGLASVLYLGYASYFILHKVCLLCAGTYVGVFGVFFVAAGVTKMPFASLPGRMLRDLKALPGSPAAAGLAVVWLAVSLGLVTLFPRDMKASAPEASAAAGELKGEAAAQVGAKAISPAQRADFERWYAAQPYSPIAVANDGAKVVVVKFNDYMCPPCKQTYMNYKPVWARLNKNFPGQVKFVTRDYPLEPECNTGGVHMASCEAAAAVRMARLVGKAEALEDWLFDNQPALTPDLVRQGVKQVAGITDFDARYQTVLAQVKADVKLGQSLGVGRTPTFFINGRKVEGGLDPEFFEAAIEYELARAAQSAKP